MRPVSPGATVKALNEAKAAMRGRYNTRPAKRVTLVRYIYGLADARMVGSELPDLACGAGIECLAVALMGAKRTVGIEIDQTGLSHMRKVLDNLGSTGLAPSVECVERSLIQGIPFGDDSFDVVLLIEAISHIVKLRTLLTEALRVTGQGGAIAIKDINNMLTIGKFRRHIALWETWEHGPIPGSEGLPELERSFEGMRKDMIQDRYPDLAEEEVAQLSAATTGTYGEGILEAVGTYLSTGRMPDKRCQRGTCPVSPNGCYGERLFDPYALATLLQDVGFSETAVMPYLTHGNWRRELINRLFVLLPHKISMPFSRGFIIIGHK